jgi:hypothetical protein
VSVCLSVYPPLHRCYVATRYAATKNRWRLRFLRSPCHKKGQSYLCNRPFRPIGLWDIEAPTFSRQSVHRWRWGYQPYAPAALYPQIVTWYSFMLESWSDTRAIVRLEGLGQLKIPMASSEIETATFRLVVQCLSQLRYRVPRCLYRIRGKQAISSSHNFLFLYLHNTRQTEHQFSENPLLHCWLVSGKTSTSKLRPQRHNEAGLH